MKHLAPLYVEESDEWPKHVTILSIRNGTVRYYRNLDIYRGFWHPIMTKMSGDYYNTNKNNHFVWTNQVVVGKDVKVDIKLDKVDRNPERIGLDKGTVINYESCDLRNPENNF